MDYKERLSHFRRIVNSAEEQTVDIHRLATLALTGIPDENSLRPRTWKLLLHLIPSAKRDWEAILYEKRCQYYNFVNELLAEPDPNDTEDHPLNSSTTSKWGTFFHDNEILEQIDKDVRRTNPDLAWFQTPVPKSCFSPLSPSHHPLNPQHSFDSLRISSPVLTPPPQPSPKLPPGAIGGGTGRGYPAIKFRRNLFKRIAHLNTSFGARERSVSAQGSVSGEPVEEENETDLHWEAIERILFIYAKLNPAIGYVQGMNELIAPLYYVLAQDELEENSAHAEADAFHLFTTLMSSLHSIFIRPAINPSRTTDTPFPASLLSHHGMAATLDRFSARLHARDADLAADLDEKGLETTFYAFRWFTCLAPGGLGLPDTIRLWDSLFADWCLEQETNPTEGDSGFRFLEDFGSHRETLLEGGFSENITLLQRRPVEDLAVTLAMAYNLREERVTSLLNEENESLPPTPSTSSNSRFKFGKDDESTSAGVSRVTSIASAQSVPATTTTNGVTSRWGRNFFQKSSGSPQLPASPKTPPPPLPEQTEDQPAKFSPGAWGASLSAASRKLNKLRLTPTISPDTSPSSSKSAVHLDDRFTGTQPPNNAPTTLSALKESTSTISARVGAVVRDSFDRRNEIISKVGGWVANSHDSESGRSSLTDWEDVGTTSSQGGGGRESMESRANEEIRRLEGEMGGKKGGKEEISPEEYIARIKRRREEREGKKEVQAGNAEDPLGAGGL